MRTDMAPLDDLLVRKALAQSANMEKIVRAVWGPTATHAKGIISSVLPCHNPDADYLPYDPDFARQALHTSSYGSASALPLLKIDLSRPNMVEMGVAIMEYWKDNLGSDLDILKRENGVPRREDSQFYRISSGSWIPDPSQIVSNLLRPRHYYPRYYDRGLQHALSLPLDHPERCAAFGALEEWHLDKIYITPIREVDPVRWVVQPWLRGFESTFNLDFNTLTTAYVVRH